MAGHYIAEIVDDQEYPGKWVECRNCREFVPLDDNISITPNGWMCQECYKLLHIYRRKRYYGGLSDAEMHIPD